MHKLLIFTLMIFLLPSQSQARETFTGWFFDYPYEYTPEKPLSENGKDPHNIQWHNNLYYDQNWHPQHWVNAKGSIEAVLQGFYNSKIIIDDDDLHRTEDPEDMDLDPRVVVGDNFMHLSGLEKRRIAIFLDYAYGVTRPDGVGHYEVYYNRTKRFWGYSDPIAVYSFGGLQLQ